MVVNSEIGENSSEKQPIMAQLDLPDQHAEFHEDEHFDETHSDIDYSSMNKQQLTEVIESLTKEGDIKKVDQVLKQIKPVFDHFVEDEKQEALDKFLKEDGVVDDFEFKGDEINQQFDKIYNSLKEKRNNFYNQQERDKNLNYNKKLALLDKLRELVDADETTESNKAIKEVQNEWKTIGNVPPQHNRNLWASFHALLDRFYNNRSIYYELKELDRKRNLEAKLELCDRAEKLVEKESVAQAIKELNELHEEYKHIGPVYKEHQDQIWQRFKDASDKIYSKRKDFLENRKQIEDDNEKAKLTLIETLNILENFSSDRINEWNDKTKEILSVQKEWEKIGPVSKEHAKDINKKFWSAFKHFFNNKNTFFKKLESFREENLKQKELLCQKAEELLVSEDIKNNVNLFKDLQSDWKKIGPVPEKYRNSIFERFKKTCDTFFDARRSQLKDVNSEFEENYKRKLAILDTLEKAVKEKSFDFELLENLQAEFGSIGYVPINKKNQIEGRYVKVVEKIVNNLGDNNDPEIAKKKLALQANVFKNSPGGFKKLEKKEYSLKKRITEIENDIAVWKNNIGFFSNSKTADKLITEIDEKIKAAHEELSQLKQQLQVLSKI